MVAATAPCAGPPPKSPKATNPAMGVTVSKGGSSETNFGAAVVVVVGAVDVEVEAASVPRSRWRAGEQAVNRPAPRSPSICRREKGTSAINPRYRGPDRAWSRQTGKSGCDGTGPQGPDAPA